MANAQEHESFTRSLPYNDKRLLELPRILVPPPILGYENGRAEFHVAEVAPFSYANNSCGDPDFLQSIQTCYKIQLNHSMLVWKYENRRQAQPILPFLFLGPSNAARDVDFIHHSNITFMLAVRSAFAVQNRSTYLNPANFQSAKGLQTATLDLDTPFDLIRNLRPVLKEMNDHLQNTCTKLPIESIDDIKGKILVFCESGSERSTVVVAAYIMVVFGVDAVTAIQIVQSQRFCINVDDGMKNMLLDLEGILRAEREVTLAKTDQTHVMSHFSQTMAQIPSLNRSSKRTLDRSYESDDTDMEDTEGMMEDGTRAGTAPFADAVP